MLQRNSLLFVLMVLMAIGLDGCKAANPVAAAQTPEQKAYATYGLYVIAAEQAASLAENTALPQSVRLGLVDAEARAKPTADALLAAVKQTAEIADQVAAGTTPQEKYLIAVNNLNSWVTQAVPLINALVAAVKGAKH